MKMTTTNKLPTTGCWIYENRRYRCTLEVSNLPDVDAKYERILKAHGIPYRKFSKMCVDGFRRNAYKEFCEYWNPDVLEEKEVSLPLYAKMPDGSYRYCERNYSEKAATSTTIKAAKETQRFIEEKIKEYEKILNEVELYTIAKNVIGDGIAEMCHSEQLAEVTEFHIIQIPLETPRPVYSYYGILLCTEEFDTFHYYSYDFNMNNNSYKIVKEPNSDWVAIFNMNKIAPNGHIHLKVPGHIAGFVIGRNHINIRAWAQVIGVKEIHVVPI